MDVAAVELEGVTKRFAKVVANKDVSLRLYSGEVLALLGENGAGKSTIMKILYGLYGLDEGRILVRGSEVHIKSPADAMKLGISMIQQHFSLVPPHNAVENIILGNVHGHISLKAHEEKIAELASRYGFDVPLDKPIGELSVGQQQKVEILKALYLNARILIMDEPTAVLTPQESDSLIRFIKEYVAAGNCAVFISHKLNEVMQVANRIAVMRNGVVVGEVNTQETDVHALARMMTGEDIIAVKRESSFDEGFEVLRFDHLSLQHKGEPKILDDINFSVHEGEVFGVAGVSGNGQDELCDIISGKTKPSEGKLFYKGEDISAWPVRKRNASGIGYVPVDRYRDAMIGDMTLSENILLKGIFSDKWVGRGIVKQKALDAYTEEIIERHRVKATGCNDLMGELSGGNQQKLVLGREVDVGSTLMVFNQPTRGLDMGAVDRIHQVILEEKKKKKAIVLVSTELSEIFDMCDRIAVMYQGRFMGIYRNEELDTAQIGLLMAGVPLSEEDAAAPFKAEGARPASSLFEDTREPVR